VGLGSGGDFSLVLSFDAYCPLVEVACVAD